MSVVLATITMTMVNGISSGIDDVGLGLGVLLEEAPEDSEDTEVVGFSVEVCVGVGFAVTVKAGTCSV